VVARSINALRSDLRGGFGWAVFGLAILIESLRMDRFTAMGGTLYTMPGLVPGTFGALLVLLGGALAWRSWRRLQEAGSDAPAIDPLLNRRIVTMLVLTLAYAVGLIGRVPFALATFLFVTAFTYAFSPDDASPRRRVVAALASGVLSTTVIVLVFEQVFLVRLP
jgi:hypothetical protein